MSQQALSVVMLGATGAVGAKTVHALIDFPELKKLTLLGRSRADANHPAISQHLISLNENYQDLLANHHVAICTLGVGQPSKVSKAEFVRVDHDLVLHFAEQCKRAGIRHFELLSAVAADAQSASFYLATKGKLERALEALEFERLSLFQPSVIRTPKNRYGLMQGLTLAATRVLNPLLMGGLSRYRGIEVQTLGRAIALNVRTAGAGVERLHWRDFVELT